MLYNTLTSRVLSETKYKCAVNLRETDLRDQISQQQPSFLANVNVLRYVCYMLSAVRLSSVCLSVCRLSVVCDVAAPYSGG